MALAAKLPSDWIAARAPNAEPRRSTEASAATAACSAVSTSPIAMPARTKKRARSAMLAPARAKPM